MDDFYPYPPEMLDLLVEFVPLLVESNDAHIDFFRGSEVPNELLSAWQARVRQDRKGFSKMK